jgi:hypothetical protein
VRDTLQKEYTLQEGVDHPLFFYATISGSELVGIHEEKLLLVFNPQYPSDGLTED